MSTNTTLVMYVAIAIAALGTTVITTTATTQLTYADNGIGNDFDKDGDKHHSEDGNNGLGNSYDTELEADRDKGIGNDVDRDRDFQGDDDVDDGNQGIGNDPRENYPREK